MDNPRQQHARKGLFGPRRAHLGRSQLRLADRDTLAVASLAGPAVLDLVEFPVDPVDLADFIGQGFALAVIVVIVEAVVVVAVVSLVVPSGT